MSNENTISSTLVAKDSLHPVIRSNLSFNTTFPRTQCALDVIYELPPSVFVDPNQLADRKSMLGQATILGETDLEVPLESVKDSRGSIVVLREPSTYPVDLPIHLRYQKPSNTPYRDIVIKPPVAGWTCLSTPTLHQRIPLPPLPEKWLRTTPAMFESFHSTDAADLQLKVPVGNEQEINMIEIGTTICVILCTLWVSVSVWKAVTRRR
ncbi:protease B nonderepressible form, partial [Apophysomyces sp. BC1021]